MRLAFKDGFLVGAAKAGLMTITGGRFPGGRIAMHADADAPRTAGEETTLVPDGVLTIGKLDAVFKSGNATRDTIPSHLLVGRDVSGEVADFYAHVCPGGGVRAGRGRAARQPAQLHRLQGHRRAGPALDPARRRQRSPLPGHVTDADTPT